MFKLQALFSFFICLISCRDKNSTNIVVVNDDSIIDYTKNRSLEDSNSNISYFMPLYERLHIAYDSMNVTIRKRKYIQTVDIFNTRREVLNGAESLCELQMAVKNPFQENMFYFIVPNSYKKVQNGLNMRTDTSTGIFYIGCYDRAYPQPPVHYFYSLYEIFINEEWASDGVIEMRYAPKKIQLSKKELTSIRL